MATENNNEIRNTDTVDSNTSRIRLKKPMSAGRYREVKKELTDSRRELASYSKKFRDLADNYPDDNELKSILKILESVTWINGTGFTELYNLYRTTATLKIQVEILKGMMLTIPQIRDNKAFRHQIEDEFDLRENIWYDPENP